MGQRLFGPASMGKLGWSQMTFIFCANDLSRTEGVYVLCLISDSRPCLGRGSFSAYAKAHQAGQRIFTRSLAELCRLLACSIRRPAITPARTERDSFLRIIESAVICALLTALSICVSLWLPVTLAYGGREE